MQGHNDDEGADIEETQYEEQVIKDNDSKETETDDDDNDMTKNLTLTGNSMMMTMKEWFLYRKMYYAACNTRQAFQPAGCY